MAGARGKFDQDFKEGAVRLVGEAGRPVAQVARDLGINEGTLGSWVNAGRRRRGDGAGGLGGDERAGLARLGRESAGLAMGRDVLKRGVAFWVKGRDGAVAVAALVAAQRDGRRIPCAVACRALGVSRSWCCKWASARPGPRAERRARLKAEVARLFALRKGRHGFPRIAASLRAAGGRLMLAGRRRSTASGTASAPGSAPRKASSASARPWTWPPAGCPGSPSASIMTRSWPTARWPWRWRSGAARCPA